MITDLRIKARISMEKNIQEEEEEEEEDCFYHHPGRKFNEETIILLHLGHSLLWC